MSELVTMYPAQANSPETSLSGALTAAGTTVNVVDGSVLPEAPNLLTIGADGSTAETVLMTAKNGNKKENGKNSLIVSPYRRGFLRAPRR